MVVVTVVSGHSFWPFITGSLALVIRLRPAAIEEEWDLLQEQMDDLDGVTIPTPKNTMNSRIVHDIPIYVQLYILRLFL